MPPPSAASAPVGSAAVYFDAVDADLGKFDRSSLEILVFTTGLLVDTLAIRKKIPSPSLSDDAGAAPAAPARPVPVAAAPPRPAPAAAPKPAPAPPPRPAPTPSPIASEPQSTVAFTAAQMREMIGASATPAAKPSAFDVPAIEFNAPAGAKVASAIPAEDRPSTQFVPPTGAARGGALAGGGSEEAKKHDEARRFARLLVSEIKLYNEAKVEQGRKSRDLYERLKEDIDRSRQMYDERISEDVRKASNYFYDELVRILAGGDAGALGPM